MPRGRQTDILTAANVAALAELGYSAPQIEALTGVKARTAWGILNSEASWGEINHPCSKQIAALSLAAPTAMAQELGT